MEFIPPAQPNPGGENPPAPTPSPGIYPPVPPSPLPPLSDPSQPPALAPVPAVPNPVPAIPDPVPPAVNPPLPDPASSLPEPAVPAVPPSPVSAVPPLPPQLPPSLPATTVASSKTSGALASKALIVLSFIILGYGVFAALTREPSPVPVDENSAGESCIPDSIGHRYPEPGKTENLSLHADSDYASYEGIVTRQSVDEGTGAAYVEYRLFTNVLPLEGGPYYLWISPADANAQACNPMVVGKLQQAYPNGPWAISFTDSDYPDDLAIIAVTNMGYGSLSADQDHFSYSLNQIVLYGSFWENWEESSP